MFDDLEFLTSNLLKIFEQIIPEDLDKTIELNGKKVTLKRKNGELSIETVSEFDDSEIKQIVADYKQKIDEVDDCIFLEALEEIKEKINIEEFDNLLKKDSFTWDEAKKVFGFIEYSSNIISNHLKVKINKLTELYNRF